MFKSLPLRVLLGAVLSSVLLTTSAWAQPPAEPLFADSASVAASVAPGHAVADSARTGRLNPSVFRASRLSITLPDGQELVADRQRETQGPRGELTWTGTFEDAPGSLLVLTRHRGAVTGFFNHGTDTYEVEGVDGGSLLLFRVDEAALPGEGDPIDPLSGGDPVGDGLALEELALAGDAAATAGDPIVQDLLVLYTPASASKAGSAATLEAKIVSAVESANAAYASSAINIRLNLVGMSQISYKETGNMSTSLTHLTTAGDGQLEGAHSLRNQTGADIVSLVTNETNYCGIGYVMNSVGSWFAAYAFNVVRQECFSQYTLAHEIGHNQGNSHDRANGTANAYPYAYGYRTCDNQAFTNGQSFRTVMAYSCSGTPRLNYFSNPNIFYNGAPMGISYESNASKSADNARSMHNTAAVVAAFRSAVSSAPPAAPTNLTATPTSSDRVSVSWTDKSNDETGFTLERAVGGGSFSLRATLSSNATSFVDSGLSPTTTYHYRTRAFNDAGSSSWTSTASATTPTAPLKPNSPSPAAVALSGTTALVTWANVTSEDSYQVVRETWNSRKNIWSATTYAVGANITSFSQSLNSGTYRYSVRAVNVAGSSAAVIANCATCGGDGSFTLGSTTTKKGGGRDKDRTTGPDRP